MKTAVIGAGPGCRAVLELFEQGKLRFLDMEILAVVDIDPDAPGIRFARRRGWTTLNSVEQALALPDLGLVIELTGLDDVLAEVRSLSARGVIEIEFLGQTVNAYRDAAGRTLADLLEAATEVNGIERIRFTTSHPAQMTERLMDAMSACRPVVCPYLHLPVQSGSDDVLLQMRRGYDRDGYLRKIDGLRSRIPELALGTDVIVWFPTES